ncbi:hypothetical protein LguiA_033948 [Lonicera macranthoides]
MDMVAIVKSEVGASSAAKSVKRRRRSSSVQVDQQGVQVQELALVQVDQSAAATTTTTTTTTVKRSSRFRGVSRWTGRYEAHLWDKGSWNVTQRKKGKQGAYDEEESAARAYDLAAIKYWGTSTFTNFPVSDYEKEVEIMENVSKEEYLASLRRRSSGFSRGVSKYRGVARHHHNGRWEARIGRVFGNKYLYLGTYGTQEEAAHAYDMAAIEYRGMNAVTNFDLSTYIRWLRSSANSNPSQDPTTTNSQPIQMTQDRPNPVEDIGFSFNPNSFSMKKPGNIFPQKQELIERKMPISPSNKSLTSSSSSSPTALGLLLRSSMFKELVEKNSNSNASDEEMEGNDTKKHRSNPSVEDDEFGGIFNYSGISSEFKEESGSPFFKPSFFQLTNN